MANAVKHSRYTALVIDAKSLGARLRKAREGADLSQTEAAEKIGVHYITISRWENGRQRIGAEDLTRAAAAYGIGVGELAGSLDDSGDSVSRGTALANSSSDYTADQRLSQRAPPRARDVGLGYISRLARAGVPHDEIERFERQLFDDRFAIQFSRRHHEEWSEEDWIAHMNSVWLHATDWLLPRGIVP